MDFVHASDYDEACAQLELVRGRVEALTAVARQLACTTPRSGEWERTYRALQARAQQALRLLDGSEGRQ